MEVRWPMEVNVSVAKLASGNVCKMLDWVTLCSVIIAIGSAKEDMGVRVVERGNCRDLTALV